MLLKVSCSFARIPLKINAHSANVPSNCGVIIACIGWRVNYERMVLMEREKGASSVTGNRLSDLSVRDSRQGFTFPRT